MSLHTPSHALRRNQFDGAKPMPLHQRRYISRVDHPRWREDSGDGKVHHMVMVPALDDIESVGGDERDVLIDDGPRRESGHRTAIALCREPDGIAPGPDADIEDTSTGFGEEFLYPCLVDRKLQRSLRRVLKALPFSLGGYLVEPTDAAH